jgi:predicted DNA-binding protein
MKLECDAKKLVKSKRISQRIDLSQNSRLVKASKQGGISCAEVIRVALENYLNSLGLHTK